LTFEERWQAVQQAPRATRHFDAELAEERLGAWVATTGISNHDELITTLFGLNCSREETLQILGGEPDQLLNEASAPQWFREIKTVIARTGYRRTVDNEYPAILKPFSTLIAFYTDALAGFLYAQTARTENAVADPESLTRNSLDWLYGRLIVQTQRAVVLENAVRNLMLDELESGADRPRTFLETASDLGEQVAFLEKYPVLGRNVQKTCAAWLLNVQEFYQRFISDIDLLRSHFSLGEGDRLTSVTPGAGDTHNGGRSVFLLSFESGARLVYKPRSTNPEKHFQELLAWINDAGFSPPLKLMRTIDRGTYGWVEFVPHVLCDTPDEVEQFYRREGALLALAYAISATDMHFENIVAHGADPILVDLETVFHPFFHSDPQTSREACFAAIRGSVMATAMLPEPELTSEKAVFDSSGIAATPGQRSPHRIIALQRLETSTPQISEVVGGVGSLHSRPQTDGKISIPDLIAGFTTAYELLKEHQTFLFSELGPIARFRADQTRAVMRPTSLYATLLSDSTHPDFLRDELDRQQHFAKLVPASTHWPLVKRLIASELRQLDDNDIPFFHLTPATTSAHGADGTIVPGILAVAMMDTVKNKIAAFSPANLEKQIWFIRASLGYDHGYARPLEGDLSRYADPCLALAVKLGNELVRRLIIADDSASFLHIQALLDDVDARHPHYNIHPARHGLYDGVGGAALFLAYLAHESGVEHFRTAAAALIGTIKEELVHADDPSISAFSGTGATIYVLTHLGILWKDHALLDLAEGLLPGLAPRIADDKVFDIISGSSGLLLTLLPLAAQRPDGPALQLAIACAEHLLKTDADGKENWRATPFQRGLSHGASGPALAFAELHRMTADPYYLATALSIADHERQLIGESEWTDRHHTATGHQCSWCHGAPGIALSRLATFAATKSTDIKVDIERTLQETAQNYWQSSHCLCHGTLGNVEPFVVAAQIPEFAPGARELIEMARDNIVHEIAEVGWRSAQASQSLGHGLMTGLAGIGYGLLRLAAPDRIPSILTLAKTAG
jgi:type 2 lantibiotic biosynthesis protein LanM